MPKEDPAALVMTIGHSTLPLEEFIGLLQANEAACVVDVRTIPRSRHNPQFNKDSLPQSLVESIVRISWARPTGQSILLPRLPK